MNNLRKVKNVKINFTGITFFPFPYFAFTPIFFFLKKSENLCTIFSGVLCPCVEKLYKNSFDELTFRQCVLLLLCGTEKKEKPKEIVIIFFNFPRSTFSCSYNNHPPTRKIHTVAMHVSLVSLFIIRLHIHKIAMCFFFFCLFGCTFIECCACICVFLHLARKNERK